MAIVFTASNLFLGGSYDLTVSPQLVLTNSSTYTAASSLAQVAAEEVSGSGYARANLTVKSNSQQPDGSYRLIYNLATFTASGGSIVFDRVALFADSQFVGYFNYGSTTIADGITKPFRSVTINRTDSGTLVNGLDGVSAQVITTGNFIQPASLGTVIVAVENTAPFPVGSYCYFSDGTNVGWYKVTAITSTTSMTVQNLGLNGSASPGATMGAGGDFVPSGTQGAPGTDGVNGFGLRYTFSATTTAPPSSGEIRFNNATYGSVTEIYVHDIDRNAANVSGITTDLTAGTKVLFFDETDTAAFGYFTVTSVIDSGSYVTFGVTPDVTGGTIVGDVTFCFSGVGASSGGSADLAYTLGLEIGSATVSAGELWTDTALLHNATEFYIADTDRSGVYSGVFELLDYGSILKIVGQSSGSIHYFSVGITSYSGIVFTAKASLYGNSGTAQDGEVLSISVIPTTLSLYQATSFSFTANTYYKYRYFINAIISNITVTLPLAASVGDRLFHSFKRIDNGTAGYTVTIVRSGSDLIDGEASQTLDAYEAFELHSDGVSNWWIL